jgi:hypothetical protein
MMPSMISTPRGRLTQTESSTLSRLAASERSARGGSRATAVVSGLKGCIAVSLAAVLAACGDTGPAEPSYFPLNKGWQWTYKLTTDTIAGSKTSEFEVTNQGSIKIGDNDKIMERRNSFGNSYYFVTTPTAITRVASKNALDPTPRPDIEELPRHVMPLPPKEGATWLVMTNLFLLTKPMDFPQEMKYGRPMPMTFEIESIDETVTVPAGTFNKCIVISGQRTLRMMTDPVEGMQDIPINQKEWYCPNAGMVKFVRAEIIKGRWISGGTFSLELTKLKR